jgi:excisionase family DNA binding protein
MASDLPPAPSPPDPTEKLLTTAELAELLQVDARTLRRWRQEGRIKALVIGRTVRFRLSDLGPS